MKKILTYSSLILFSVCVFAESTITFPGQNQLNGQKKDLLLKITIPNELAPEEEYQEKKIDTSYFDLDPWKKIDRESLDWETLKSLTYKGIITRERSKILVRSKRLKTEYDMFLVISDIIYNLERKNKDYMIEKGVNREDLAFIESLIFKQYPGYMKKSMLTGEDLKKRLTYLKKQFLSGKGEVKVLRVETNNAGETMIHIRLTEED